MTGGVVKFGFLLCSMVFAGSGRPAVAPNDEQARALAIHLVASATGISQSDLNTKRLEDMEDDLFSAQIKVRGKIKKGAYFFRVESGGYRITPDEVKYQPHSAQGWYVAVSTTDGETFGLYGFKDAEAAFRRLISKLGVEVGNTSQAEAFARFYLEAVHQASASIVYDELRLKHNVEEHFVGYADSQEPMTKKEARFRQWWRGFKANKVERLAPNTRAEGNGRYRVALKILEMTVGRSPELSEWSVEVQNDGAVELAGKRQIFPSTSGSSRIRHGSTMAGPT